MIEIEKTIEYTSFPKELQQILIRDHIEGGSQNGSYSYIELEDETDLITKFLLECGAEIGDTIMIKLSW